MKVILTGPRRNSPYSAGTEMVAPLWPEPVSANSSKPCGDFEGLDGDAPGSAKRGMAQQTDHPKGEPKAEDSH